MDESQIKVAWTGEVVSVQPRSTVWRYLTDNRTHREIGYNIFLRGTVRDGDEEICCPANKNYDFCVAISEKQQEKLKAHIGDELKGTAWTPLYPEEEFADYYRAGALKKIKPADPDSVVVPEICTEEGDTRYDGTPIPRVHSDRYPGPAWTFEAPPLTIYAWRGEQLLSKASWRSKCFRCVWANMANVTVEYNFDTGSVKHRFESFCYGPKSCKYYKMGPARAVPYYGVSGVKDYGDLDDICTEYRNDWDE